ncbi:hypothetical protein CONCODRAFT_19268 [Conidiobolus coronatus NRRL 28638]|uniref:RNI-like protein n=1 Tax=Conidiobolus coronatus (strain ATCC 28846 / CBS 209.66 / NRRL 28638) TaxID=796925 RepID=A0A137NZD0_CONC2|nr:hypothetical protein CONCODRAFT_19268 [Conidiobolus coronatus NRRL 28638]|eukprot:KXN67984.1 hypothetical protein CONCODRAFT_19268 [Conidiobolus coronatus NRRL 28638]
MTKLNSWELILSWKDTTQYFYKFELLEISTTCKLIRQKLKPVIFHELDFTWFPPHFDDNEGSDNEKSDEDLLIEQMLPISKFLKSLSIGAEFNFNYLITLLPLITQLEYLQIFGTTLEFEQITHVLNKLNQLKCLKLNSCKIAFFSINNEIDMKIDLPKSLTGLHIEKCYYIKSASEFDPLLSRYDFDENTTTRHCFGLKPELFPKLTQFTYDSKLDESSTLDFSRLNSITNLKLLNLGPASIRFANSFTLACPNLTQLSLHYHSQLEPNYNQLLDQLSILTKLTLIGYKGNMSLIRTGLKLDKVKHLYLTRFYIDQINLEKFEEFKLLESVVIRYSYIEDELEELIETYYKQFTNWKCRFMRDFIKCTKL